MVPGPCRERIHEESFTFDATADAVAIAPASVGGDAYRVEFRDHGRAVDRTGETLAVFTDLVSPSELPRRSASDTFWETLPPDPRASAKPRSGLRVIRDDG